MSAQGLRAECGERLALATARPPAPHSPGGECADTPAQGRAWPAPRPMRAPLARSVPVGACRWPCGACHRVLLAALAVRCRGGIGQTTGPGCGCAMLALWFLLRGALAGPHRETPPPPSRLNAGTAEPCRVSPPEAVAYPLELL